MESQRTKKDLHNPVFIGFLLSLIIFLASCAPPVQEAPREKPTPEQELNVQPVIEEQDPIPVIMPDVQETAEPVVEILSDPVIQSIVDKVYKKYKNLKEGKNADYIPALAKVNSKLFGISLITVDGKVCEAGDVQEIFSIQSISKVLTLALAMQQHGDEVVLEKIGVNATGQPFNSIMAIEMMDQRSVNPLVNAGALATTSLISADTADQKWELISGFYNDCAGRRLEILQDVYISESENNQRNQAIAKLLQAYGRMYDVPETSVDIYTRQCSLGVDTHDLAMMSAALANGGVNPLTGKKVIDEKYIPKILAVMATAGLYDNSGTWLYRVGLPAKSGVGGGIIAVAPGKFGIAAFSPPLDAAGNSVRAKKAIEDITVALNANVFLGN